MIQALIEDIMEKKYHKAGIVKMIMPTSWRGTQQNFNEETWLEKKSCR